MIRSSATLINLRAIPRRALRILPTAPLPGSERRTANPSKTFKDRFGSPAAVQGIEKTSIQCPSLPIRGPKLVIAMYLSRARDVPGSPAAHKLWSCIDGYPETLDISEAAAVWILTRFGVGKARGEQLEKLEQARAAALHLGTDVSKATNHDVRRVTGSKNSSSRGRTIGSRR